MKNDFIKSLRRLQQQIKDDYFGQDKLTNQIPLIKRIYKRHNLEINLTCGACPEQYEVFKDGKQIAYYRLRHGEFRVDHPECGGETIYESEPQGDGVFEGDERLKYLLIALRILLNKIK